MIDFINDTVQGIVSFIMNIPLTGEHLFFIVIAIGGIATFSLLLDVLKFILINYRQFLAFCCFGYIVYALIVGETLTLDPLIYQIREIGNSFLAALF